LVAEKQAYNEQPTRKKDIQNADVTELDAEVLDGFAYLLDNLEMSTAKARNAPHRHLS